MMDDNSDSSDDDHQLLQDDVEEIEVEEAEDAEEIEGEEEAVEDDARQTRHLQINKVLEKKELFSVQTRNLIDELIEDFLYRIKNDIHAMICDNSIDDAYDDYRGLDSDRDTEEEVETTLRCFPELLSGIKEDGKYPIECLSYFSYEGRIICNLYAVSFIPLVARLSKEFGLFREEDREALILIRHGNIDNVLHNLMLNDTPIPRYSSDRQREHNETVDNKHLIVMKRLRQMGLLKKEDIQRYHLLDRICCQNVLAEKRLRYLIEWDPTALLQPVLYLAAQRMSTQTFRAVFEYGIRYYPKKKGITLLFRKNDDGMSSFRLACNRRGGRDEVMRIVEEILIRYSSSSDNSPQLNVAEALIMAAIDEHIHLDCVYFLLRRHPDALVRLLSGSTSSSPASALASEGDSNGNNNTRDSSKKRKRGSSLLL